MTSGQWVSQGMTASLPTVTTRGAPQATILIHSPQQPLNFLAVGFSASQLWLSLSQTQAQILGSRTERWGFTPECGQSTDWRYLLLLGLCPPSSR